MSEKSPHYLGHRQRLRERFEKGGLEGFAPHEVVELLLTLAIPRKDVKQPAKALLAHFGSLRGILDAPLSELREVPGIGQVAPVALRIIREAADLYLQHRPTRFFGTAWRPSKKARLIAPPSIHAV